MRHGLILILAFALLGLSACGQKGPLYIPPTQESPAAQPPEAGATAGEASDEKREDVELSPAETQNEATLEDEDGVFDEEEKVLVDEEDEEDAETTY